MFTQKSWSLSSTKVKTAGTTPKGYNPYTTPNGLQHTRYNDPTTKTRLAQNPTLKGEDTKHRASQPCHDQRDTHRSRP
jgi:hypothetical protein